MKSRIIKIVVVLFIGIVVGIAASKLYLVALRAGHTASFLPDYIIGIVFGCPGSCCFIDRY